MADLTTSNSSYQTGTVDTASTLVDNTDDMKARHVNGPNSAILQIETILGLASSLIGSVADLATRLAIAIAGTGKLNDFSATTKTTFPGAVSEGCTGLTAGTSGGVLTFTATGTLASSGLLGAGHVVCGGGAGVVPTSVSVPQNGLLVGSAAGSAPTSIAAGSASTVLAVPSGGGAPSFSAVKPAMLSTATASVSGSSSTNITMNDYSFFPATFQTAGASGAMSMNPVAAADSGTAVATFALVLLSGSPSFTVRWRYMTATDDPVIWLAVDATGAIRVAWASDDPTPDGRPGVAVEGCASVRLVAADLAYLNLSDASREQATARILRDGLKPEHMLYRALQVEANDEAPSAWIHNHCRMDGGRLVRR